MTRYRNFIIGLVAAWFAFSASASAAHWFRNDDNRFGIGVALAAGLPLILFAAWWITSEKFRQFAMSLSPSTLTLAQSWRILGFTFVLLEARGALPAIFALPAGYGDMFIGATATIVAWKLANPSHRRAFIFWQALGITDLVLAVGLGTTARLLDPEASMAAMTVLPLSLIPTFFVPLLLMLHVISIAQARSWKRGLRSEASQKAGVSGFLKRSAQV
jgi:hypothetical protein